VRKVSIFKLIISIASNYHSSILIRQGTLGIWLKQDSKIILKLNLIIAFASTISLWKASSEKSDGIYNEQLLEYLKRYLCDVSLWIEKLWIFYLEVSSIYIEGWIWLQRCFQRFSKGSFKFLNMSKNRFYQSHHFLFWMIFKLPKAGSSTPWNGTFICLHVSIWKIWKMFLY
jgi:hypothetical protein